MSSRLKSILFAAILCFVCSAILTTASTGLQRFQKQNMRIDRHRNILMSVGLVKSDQRYAADGADRDGGAAGRPVTSSVSKPSLRMR